MRQLAIALLALAAAAPPVGAGCQEELAEVDRQLAAAEGVEPQLLQVLKQMRDQGAAACAAGKETSAGASFQSITMMLSVQAQARAAQAPPDAAGDGEEAQEPTSREAAGAGAAPDAEGGLLPYVVVRDPAAMDALDWPALRRQAGTDYPSRWDDLTLVDSCLWITPDELTADLGLTLEMTTRRQDAQCNYWVQLPGGDSGVLLSVYVERHESPEYPREAELGFSSGVGGMQFAPFDAGAGDLHVYLHKRGKYLYAFPQGGRTYWALRYKPSYGMDGVYDPGPGAGLTEEIGARYMKLLVKKYGGRL